MTMMMTSLVVSISMMAGTTAAFGAGATFERTVPVGAQPDVYIATGSGHVHVMAGQDGQVHIVGHVSSGWHGGDDTNDRIRQIVSNPPVTQAGNGLHIGEVSDRRLFENISIDYEVSVPKMAAVNAHTGSGDLEVGSVRFLHADTGSGSIRARGVAGAAELHTGSGDVELEQTGLGDVKATTGSGTIHINGLQGGLTARTGSGDIEATGHMRADTKLQSGSGSIKLHLGREAKFTLDASTGSGSIRVAQPGAPQGSEEKHHVSGVVNGGGPALEARTGSGDVRID